MDMMENVDVDFNINYIEHQPGMDRPLHAQLKGRLRSFQLPKRVHNRTKSTRFPVKYSSAIKTTQPSLNRNPTNSTSPITRQQPILNQPQQQFTTMANDQQASNDQPDPYTYQQEGMDDSQGSIDPNTQAQFLAQQQAQATIEAVASQA
ncbi:hypothetical protein KEM56_006319, partial [Ascosphaera pollenicola]